MTRVWRIIVVVNLTGSGVTGDKPLGMLVVVPGVVLIRLAVGRASNTHCSVFNCRCNVNSFPKLLEPGLYKMDSN